MMNKIRNGNGDQQVREVVAEVGNVSECILESAQTRARDLIVLGNHEGTRSKSFCQ